MSRRAAGVVLLLLAGTTFALGADGVPAVLDLKAGVVRTAERENLLARDDAGAMLKSEPRLVLQLAPSPSDAERAALARTGAVLYDYLPENAYIADLGACDAGALRALGFVSWVGRMDPAWKLAPDLGLREYTEPALRSIVDAGSLPLLVSIYAGLDPGPTVAAMNAIPGLRVLRVEAVSRWHEVSIVAPGAGVPALAAIPGVQFVEPAPEVTLRSNATTRWVVQSNLLNVTPLYDAGLTGVGQIVGVLDSGVAVNHCSFQDTVNPIGPLHRKIHAFNRSLTYGQHGTHVACTAVGDDGSTGNTRGIAYGGRLVYNSTPSFGETSVFNAFNTHRSQGAFVHTNSWGNDGTTNYDAMCRGIDDFSWRFDDNLVLFAVTNTSTLKNPENSKNCLAVAASSLPPNQGNQCTGGAGPTNDGRRKPEITAPGCGISSASGSTGCGTASLTGTSMATPAVAGTALLVRQYYTQGYYPSGAPDASRGFTPSGSLIKATLLNSAQDMAGVAGYPANREGWGRVLADAALAFTGETRRLVVRDVRNETPEAFGGPASVEVPFIVGAGPGPLRATLVFHEPAASLNANPATVNNLNLRVVAPDGTVYLGNAFSDGFSTPGGQADPRNNVEQVHILAPATGRWLAIIDAATINSGRQGYALVITGVVSDRCPADFNNDGEADFFDYLDFVAAFDEESPAADFDGNGQIDFFDYLGFVEALSRGC